MKYLLNISRIIIIIILSFILLINIFVLVSKFLFKQYPPKLFNYFYATVLSGSMEPVFSKGDLLLFKVEKEYKVNDIVMFKEEGNLITHRIVEINDSKYITKGEANNTKDELEITKNDIEGKMIKIIPNVGTISEFFRSPLGLAIVIIGGLLAIEVPDIIYHLKSRRLKDAI